MKRWPVACLSATFLFLGATSHPLAGQAVRELSLAFDNDGFAFWVPPDRRTDWFYTHGTRLEAVVDWSPPGLGFLESRDDSGEPDSKSVGAGTVTRFGLGQEIYTPEDVFFYTPDLQDRPYAGWLYASVARERTDALETVRVSILAGVTGEPSFGRQVHKGVHRWLDKYPPQGWEYQIPFEVGVAASYYRARRIPLIPRGNPVSVALLPHWTAMLGTVRTSGALGLSMRTGWHAPAGLGWKGGDTSAFYLLAEVGTEGELVLRDLFLDGSTWGHSASVEKEPFLGRLRGRVQAGWRGMGLEFDVTRSTRSFRGQDKGHVFGTVSFIVRP